MTPNLTDAERSRDDRDDTQELRTATEAAAFVLEKEETTSFVVAATSHGSESPRPLYSDVESAGLTDEQAAEHHAAQIGVLIRDVADRLEMDPLEVAEQSYDAAIDQ